MPFVQARIAIPSNKAALDAALEGLVRLDLQIIRAAKAAGRPIRPLYKSGVRWQPDKSKGKPSETWDTIDIVRARGYGDCEDLAAWRAAELRAAGVNARAVVKRSNTPGVAWHAIVQLPDGKLLDPSAKLGMHGWKGVGKPPSEQLTVGGHLDADQLGADLIKAIRAVSRQLDTFAKRFA